MATATFIDKDTRVTLHRMSMHRDANVFRHGDTIWAAEQGEGGLSSEKTFLVDTQNPTAMRDLAGLKTAGAAL